MNELVRAAGLGKVYRRGPATVEVLRDLDFSLDAGGSVAVVGASGVGKSTLLNCLGGLDRPTSGDVVFMGQSVSAMGEAEAARHRGENVGFVFQFHYLLPEFSALENVMMPLRIRGLEEGTSVEKSRELLHAMGLSHRLDHRPPELSGGEQQRVAIARALVGSPALILADEPTGNLDRSTAEAVMGLLMEAVRQRNAALVLATHNLELAGRTGCVLWLKEGRLAGEDRA